MSRRLPWLLLLAALAALAQPAPPTDKDEDVLPDDPVEEPVDEPDPNAPPVVQPGARALGADVAPAKKKSAPGELTDDEAAMLGFASICCCGVGFLGLVGLIVWLVRRTSKPAAPVQPGAGPPAAASQGPLHLSILALGLTPQARAVIEQQLSQLGVAMVPTAPDTRGRLVREAARALLTVEPSWRHFGYGEKPSLFDLASAEASYRAASDDFRARAVASGAAGGEGLVVLTLLVCSRRSLMGVSRLDDPLQVRSVLEDRLHVSDDELLGAELLWAPTPAGSQLSEAEAVQRFPEMQPLARPAI